VVKKAWEAATSSTVSAMVVAVMFKAVFLVARGVG
jgi:hypothetical protein